MAESQSTVTYRPVPGFPRYRVGDDGSVWVRTPRGWHRMKMRVGKRGYCRVVLNPGAVRRLVHHLVLEAFVGPRPAGMECLHEPDPHPGNNRLSNLRWGTRAENVEDAQRHGRYTRGERHWQARLTPEAVRAIRADSAAGMSQHRLARKYGVSRSTICHVVMGATWKHVTG